jgi:hypothetical protein
LSLLFLNGVSAVGTSIRLSSKRMSACPRLDLHALFAFKNSRFWGTDLCGRDLVKENGHEFNDRTHNRGGPMVLFFFLLFMRGERNGSDKGRASVVNSIAYLLRGQELAC